LLVGAAAAWGAVMLLSPVAGWTLLGCGVATIALVWLLARFASGPLGRSAKGLLFALRLLVMPLSALGRALRSDWDVWKPQR
jgi:hypothetical protein